MSNVKKSKHLDYGGGSQKNIDIMRFTDIDIKIDVKYEGHQICPKTFSMHILKLFHHHQYL